MRLLEKEFIAGANGLHNNHFKLLKREKDVAMYERRNTDKSFLGIEVFKVKERFKGDPLPGGMFEKEDREVYCTSSAFGHTAYFCVTSPQAEKRFKQLLMTKEDKKQETIEENEEKEIQHEESVAAKQASKEERKKSIQNIKIPKGEFVINDVLAANPILARHDIVIFIKTLVEDKKVKKIGEKKGSKGRAATIYKIV